MSYSHAVSTFRVRSAYNYSVSSMIYGRPIGIPYGHLSTSPESFPRPIDDSCLAKGQTQSRSEYSINAFFVYSVRLYYLMDEVLERLHRVKGVIAANLKGLPNKSECWPVLLDGTSILPYLTAVIQLDGMLLAWHDSLPKYLKFSLEGVDVNRQRPLWLQRQTIVLRCRFLSLRVLLHRQTVLFLVQPERNIWQQNGLHMWPPLYSDTTTDMTVGSSIELRHLSKPSLSELALAHLSAKTCVMAALLQIESINLYAPVNLTEAWWWDFNCQFRIAYVLAHGSNLLQLLSTPFAFFLQP